MVTNKISGFVLMIMSFMILLGCCSATVFKVGDSNGWTAKNDAYVSWVMDKKFHVGDSLMFEYDRNVNDVTQVSSPLEYLSCDSPSPKAVYNTGHDVVTFTEPGFHFFISSNLTQCISGMRLNVFVGHDPSRSTPPPPPPPPPPAKVSEPSRTISPPPKPSRQVSSPPSKVNETSRPILPPPPPPPNNTLPSGKIYKVGDSRGWSISKSYYYYRWSQDREFYVGDTLFFQYNKKINDVEEISDEVEFRNCETNYTVAVYKTGHDFVKLTKPGVHYFVSMKTGLCTAGIKLQVNVLPSTKAPNVPRTLPPIHRPSLWWWLRFPFRPPHH